MEQQTRANQIPFNVNKLKHELAKTGKPVAEHSRACGYESGYFHNILHRGYMTRVTQRYLESIGITLDMIQDKQPEIKVSAKQAVVDEHSNEELLAEVRELNQTISDMAVSIRTIGNLLTQINENTYQMGGKQWRHQPNDQRK